MRSLLHRHSLAALAVSLLIFALGTVGLARAGGQDLSQLNLQLGATQATAANLRGDLTQLNAQIAELQRQVALVQGREAAVQGVLTVDETRLNATRGRLNAVGARLSALRRRLARAQRILAAQLVSRYEQPSQNLMSVVLEAHGFSQLLNRIQYLQDAEHVQQHLITVTTAAKRATASAAAQLARVKARQLQAADAAAVEAGALQNMQTLLDGRRTALAHVESARQTALVAVQARGARLQSAINTIRAQQAAAARAAAAAQAAARAAASAAAARAAAAAAAARAAPARTPAAVAAPTPPVVETASGGWAIPAAVVMCESGGQNLPPNSAGASGYYQILPSTWTGEGGSGPAAYLAPKSEQDAIAAKLWNGGAGASNWVCAGIVGIT